ncbi:MAG: lipopolysaccharide transport periplasmic protein LptA [Gammaproteobacteria bacterium]|nr:lipopolysaccharide transport periplasmic protein LptA [Gammaproteobacteria bacterium]
MFHHIKINRTSPLLYALALLFLPASTAFSAGDDSSEAIRIQAHYMRFDLETGSSIYEGEVTINQGGISLSGDKVAIQRLNDKIQQIEIDGQPARYIQDEHTENKIYATSQHMQYLANQNRLIMTVDARLEQPDHTIESQRIVYDTQNKIVIAGNNEQAEQGGRVNITLTPKKENIESP